MVKFTLMKINQRHSKNAPLFDGSADSVLFQGKAKLSELMKLNIGIDRWELDKKDNGYQRQIKNSRANMFAEYIADGNISPDILTFSIRPDDLKNNSESVPKRLSSHDDFYSLDLDSKIPIQLVDGQHRWFGLKDIESATSVGGTLADFELPFILMYSAPKLNEIVEFMTRHKTQKAVPTDLADQLLREAKGQKLYKQLEKQLEANKTIWKDIVWAPEALDVIDCLRTDPTSVWHKNIRMPTESANPFRVCTQRTFTSSIKPLMVSSKRRDAPFENVKPQIIAKYLNANWNALKAVLQEPFKDLAQSKYVVFHLVGVYSLNLVYYKLLSDETIGVGSTLLEYGKNGQFDKLQTALEGLYDVDAITNADNWDKYYEWIGPDGEPTEGGIYTLMGSNHAAFKRLSEIILNTIQSKKSTDIAKLQSLAPKISIQKTLTKKESKK
uniref:DGQHR domain-containing protein n=1 Tax=uncultured marine thaumarchaeote KM3_53_H02 TaxID=1456187 RepID=A0A075HBS7_9ARCH|nr:hypothetical protein [uncultured marine thaumarchaeote KM3_53_H02]